MHAELDALHKRVDELKLVREISTSHRSDEMNHLRLRKKLAAWRRKNGFDIIEVQDERQHRSEGHMCSVDDLKHCQTDVYFDPRRPPTPQKFAKSMWAAVNILKQEILLS